MKLNKHWSQLFCLVCFCIVALMSSIANAQQEEDEFPKYMVMGVVYAPPGAASNVTYGNSTLVGSVNTMSNTTATTNSSSGTVGISIGVPIFGSFGASYTSTDTWGTSAQNSNSVAIQTATGNSVSTMGPISSSLGVDHDNDVVYIWLNPVVSGTSPGGVPSAGTFNWGGTSALTMPWISSNGCDPNNPLAVLMPYQQNFGCDPNQFPYPDIIGIPVWCLKNPYYPAESCAQWLPYTQRAWDVSSYPNDQYTHLPLGPGLTMRDYADILQSDPFVLLNGSEVNVCHPTYGPTLDPFLSETLTTPILPSVLASVGLVDYADPYDPAPTSTCTGAGCTNTGFYPLACYNSTNDVGATMNRFQPYGAVEYPVPEPNGLPTTYAGTFNYSKSTTNAKVATDTHTVSSSWSASFFGSGGGGSNSTSWEQQSSTANTNGTTSSASYSITGPQLSDNYNGPATYNVYLDNVYGTYAFYSNIEPPITPQELVPMSIQINGVSTPCSVTSATPCFSFPAGTAGVSVGSQSALYNVILTNNSTLSMTLPGPAITFSDPGFSVVENLGNDTCSNQLLLPKGTTQPNSQVVGLFANQCQVQIQFAPVYSDILVAGTTHAPTMNVYADIIAAGTLNIDSYRNILETSYAVVAGSVNTLDLTGSPTVSCTPPLTAYTGMNPDQQQTCLFTNNSNIQQINIAANDLIMTDVADYQIINDNCRGQVLNPKGQGANSCIFTLQYQPSIAILSQSLTSGWCGADAYSLPQPVCSSNRLNYSPLPITIKILGGMSFPNAQWSNAGESVLGQWQSTGTITSGLLLPSTVLDMTSATFIYARGTTVSTPMPFTVTNSTSYTVSNLTFPTINSGWAYTNGTCAGVTLQPSGHSGSTCTEYVSVELQAAPTSNRYQTNYVTVSGTFTSGPGTGYTLPNSVEPANFFFNYSTCGACGGLKRVIISGTEKSTTTTIPTSHAIASLTLKPAHITATSKGTVSVTVGGFKVSTPYVAGATAATVVRTLVGNLNFNSWSPVTAAYSGDVITLTSKATGSVADITLVAVGDANFALQTSGNALTGGAKPTTTTKYDTGTVNYTTNGVTASATWGSTSTAQSLAVALAASINKVAGAYWSASASGDVITLTGVSHPAVAHGAIVPTGQIKAAVADAAGFSPASFSVTTN